jgi:hypothetical protein
LTGCGDETRLLVEERVMGAEYEESCSRSDGVGLGEMTRGVAGTLACLRRVDMVKLKGGRVGQGAAPTAKRRRYEVA